MKNLIFDLGGVIINIDFQLTVNALRAWQTELEGKDWQVVAREPFFYAYETGQIGFEEFITQLAGALNIQATTEELKKAWNALLLDIPKERVELLQQLAKTHRLFLLSNTNAVHIEGVEEELYRAAGIKKLDELFEKVYYSFDVQMVKPEHRIYEYVLNDAGLLASESVFFDDSLPNVEAARQCGITGVHIIPGSFEILHYFNQIHANEKN